MLKSLIPALLLAAAITLACGSSGHGHGPTEEPVTDRPTPTAEEREIARALDLADDLWECIQGNKVYRYEVSAALRAAGASKLQADALLDSRVAFRADTLNDIRFHKMSLAEIKELNQLSEAAIAICREGS